MTKRALITHRPQFEHPLVGVELAACIPARGSTSHSEVSAQERPVLGLSPCPPFMVKVTFLIMP